MSPLEALSQLVARCEQLPMPGNEGLRAPLLAEAKAVLAEEKAAVLEIRQRERIFRDGTLKDIRAENPECLHCNRKVDITGLPGRAGRYICEHCANGARIVPLRDLKTIDAPAGVVLKRYRIRERRCHEIAGNFMFDNPTWTLHHAILFHWDVEGVDYPHAFAEKDGVVYDPTLNKFYEKDNYYSFFVVSVKATYTVEEMAKALLKHNEWCAWYCLEAGEENEELEPAGGGAPCP